MIKYKPQLSILQQEILRFLMINSGGCFNARQIAKHLKRTQVGIAKALPNLEKKELIKIKKDKESGRWSIEFNRDNQKAIELKRVENLKMIYETNLINYLKDNFPRTTTILFGSYSRGEDIQGYDTEESISDIDLTIIGAKEKNISLENFKKLLKRKIIINFYPSFKEIHKHLKENILNGILLSRGIEI